MSERIRVIIKDKKFIPTVGNGPILKPIAITKNQLTLFSKLGFNVQIIGDSTLTIPVEQKEEKVEEVVETPVEEKVEEVVETPVEEKVEEVVETPVEEVVETETTEPLDVDSLSKDELKALLDEKGIKYKYNAKLDELKDLLKKA